MDKLTENNKDQAIIAPTWEQMTADIPDAINTMVMAALGVGNANTEDMPLWYVLIKAAGSTGVDVRKLFDDPLTRQLAIGAMAVDTQAQQKVAMAHNNTAAQIAAQRAAQDGGQAQQ